MARPPVTLEIDQKSLRDFDRALRDYHAASRKDIPEVLNRTALNLAFWASYFCHKGPNKASEVEAGMHNPYAVMNWKYTQKGWVHPKRNEIDKALKTFLASRAATSAFIARGWAKAGNIIKDRTGIKSPVRLTRQTKKDGFGRAILAREAIYSFAEIANMAASKSKSSGQALLNWGETAMKQAITYKVQDMYVYINRKLAQRAAEFNRK